MCNSPPKYASFFLLSNHLVQSQRELHSILVNAPELYREFKLGIMAVRVLITKVYQGFLSCSCRGWWNRCPSWTPWPPLLGRSPPPAPPLALPSDLPSADAPVMMDKHVSAHTNVSRGEPLLSHQCATCTGILEWKYYSLVKKDIILLY